MVVVPRTAEAPASTRTGLAVGLRPDRRTAPLPEGHVEQHALAAGMRREKRRHVVVEERESGRADAERVGGEIRLAGLDRGLDLRHPVAAVAEALEHRPEV